MKKYLPLLVLVVGCASGKIAHVDTALDKSAISKTTPIFVEPILADNAEISGDKSGKADVVAKEKSSIATMYNQKIAEALKKKGYDAKFGKSAKTGVVISGNVTKIEHGSAAARWFVGMGAGSSNIYTNFKIEDRTQGKVLSQFQVVATSGGESGVGSYLDQHLANGAKQVAEYIGGKEKK